MTKSMLLLGVFNHTQDWNGWERRQIQFSHSRLKAYKNVGDFQFLAINAQPNPAQGPARKTRLIKRIGKVPNAKLQSFSKESAPYLKRKWKPALKFEKIIFGNFNSKKVFVNFQFQKTFSELEKCDARTFLEAETLELVRNGEQAKKFQLFKILSKKSP